MTSESMLGKELREKINLEIIWAKLSDEEKEELKKSFTEVINTTATKVLNKKDKSFKAFKRGLARK